MKSIKTFLSEEKLRVTDRDFNKKLTDVLGEKVAGKCWNNNKLDLAKEITFAGKGLPLNGGSFHTDCSEVTVIWEPVEDAD